MTSLGIIGDEKLLGKPVGADIREGKRTVIARESWVRADAKQQQKLIDETLGNPARIA
jgi:geranylgeranyl diphosphate synthase type I